MPQDIATKTGVVDSPEYTHLSSAIADKTLAKTKAEAELSVERDKGDKAEATTVAKLKADVETLDGEIKDLSSARSKLLDEAVTHETEYAGRAEANEFARLNLSEGLGPQAAGEKAYGNKKILAGTTFGGARGGNTVYVAGFVTQAGLEVAGISPFAEFEEQATWTRGTTGNNSEVQGDGSIPVEVTDPFMRSLQFGPIQTRCRTYTASGKVSVPVVDGTTFKAMPVGKTATNGPSDNDPHLDAVELDPIDYITPSIEIKKSLIAMGGFDVEGTIMMIMGEGIGRGVNDHMTNGTGSNQIQGITLTAKPTALTTAGSPTYAELNTLRFSVDVGYAASGNFGWMMHQETLGKIMGLTGTIGSAGGDGQPIFRDAMNIGFPPSLLGWPVFINNDMQKTGTAGNRSIFFGSFQAYAAARVNFFFVEQFNDLTAAKRGGIAYVGQTIIDAKAAGGFNGATNTISSTNYDQVEAYGVLTG